MALVCWRWGFWHPRACGSLAGHLRVTSAVCNAMDLAGRCFQPARLKKGSMVLHGEWDGLFASLCVGGACNWKRGAGRDGPILTLSLAVCLHFVVFGAL